MGPVPAGLGSLIKEAEPPGTRCTQAAPVSTQSEGGPPRAKKGLSGLAVRGSPLNLTAH